MILRIRLVAPTLSLLAALVARPAQAIPDYPSYMRGYLALDYAPPCSVCHQYGKTGNATPTEPFAWSLRARGLGGEGDSIGLALTSDEKDNVDSDGDGVADIVELRAGTDPNSAANDCLIPSGTSVDASQCTPGIQPSPTLGCGQGGEQSRESRLPVAVPLVGLLGFARSIAGARRRRR